MPIEIAQKIEQRIKALEKETAKLEGLGSDKALAIALYDKDLAVTLIQLRNGKAFTLEGENVKDPPAGLCDKIAKGIVWESKLRLEQAETAYKNCVSRAETLRATINAWQTINRHLAELPENR
jgi:hypothetical protein